MTQEQLWKEIEVLLKEQLDLFFTKGLINTEKVDSLLELLKQYKENNEIQIR